MYVYILVHASEPRFKLGWTGDLSQRFKSLGVHDRLDLSRSRFLAYTSNRRANDIEKRLKETFTDYHIDPAELRTLRGKRDGDTEWYRQEAFERVLRYVQENSDLIGDAKLYPVVLPEDAVETIPSTEPIKLDRDIQFPQGDTPENSDLETLTALEVLYDLLCSASILLWMPEKNRRYCLRPEKRLIAQFMCSTDVIETVFPVFEKAHRPISYRLGDVSVLITSILQGTRQGFECTVGINLEASNWWHGTNSFPALSEDEVFRLRQVVEHLTHLSERRTEDVDAAKRFMRRWP